MGSCLMGIVSVGEAEKVLEIMQPNCFEAGMADRCHVLCPGPNSRSFWGMARASPLQTCDRWSDILTRVASCFGDLRIK